MKYKNNLADLYSLGVTCSEEQFQDVLNYYRSLDLNSLILLVAEKYGSESVEFCK